MSDKPQWRCKTCKHRKPDNDAWLKSVCTRIKGPQNYDDDDFVLDEELAYTADASGYRSEVEVRDDFGCVLWEQKSE